LNNYNLKLFKFSCVRLNTLKLLILAVSMILADGCSTIYTQSSHMSNRDCDYCSYTPQIYSGTATNICGLRSENLLILVNIIDLPLSFVADTLILPYTVYKQYSEGSLCWDGKYVGPMSKDTEPFLE